MAERLEAGQTTTLGLVGVNGVMLEIPPAGMGGVIRAARHGAAVPAIIDVKHQRYIHGNCRMQARSRLPRAETHASEILTLNLGMNQGHPVTVTGNTVAFGIERSNLDLKTLQR